MSGSSPDYACSYYSWNTIIPASPLFPAGSSSPLASADTSVLAPGSAGLSAGETGPNGTIAAAPDQQPTIYSQSIKAPPSTLDKVLAAGVDLAGTLGTALIKSSFGGNGNYSFTDIGPQHFAGDGTEDDSSVPSAPGDSGDAVYAAGGGHIFGPGTGTSDSIPARLSHGEYVINAASTAKHLPLIHAINDDRLKSAKFAVGGYVGFDDGGFVSPSMAYLPAMGASAMPSSVGSQIASNAASTPTRAASNPPLTGRSTLADRQIRRKPSPNGTAI